MAEVGLVIRDHDERILALARDLIHWTKNQKHGLIFEESTAHALAAGELGMAMEALVSHADPIVTLGGDGTLIGVARHVGKTAPVLIGVNFGHLGFLTEIAPTELLSTLDSVLKGTARLGLRSMLQVSVQRNGSNIFTSHAVNDVVVQKGSSDRLIDLDVYDNSEELLRLRADGLIIATPTGSTAYSLAAGGSIVHPSLAVMLLTPICPHSLTNRPLILPLESVITVIVPEHEGDVYVTADGQVSELLQPGDKALISLSKNNVKFVRSPNKSYFEILRNKLNWGIPNKPD